MKKVIYFVSEDWVFLNHRLELAKKIQKKGYKVTLVTNVTHYKNLIERKKMLTNTGPPFEKKSLIISI